MGDTIAIQAFSKADTILATLNSVVRCRGSENYDLLILQDGCFGSKRTEKYREARADTTRAIEAWAVANCQHFLSLSFQQADQNHGPYAIAERVINKAFETSKSVIFSEDDVIFEEDAIQWFERALSHPGFLHPAVWAVAGEAKFFDAKRHAPSPKEIRRALDVARSKRLIDRFVYYDFLPSSCFATTRHKWAEFGKTRGAPNGDRDVNLRCRAEGKVCLWPVVARCRDIGMHHPLGYTVRWTGANHATTKNSYVVSGMLQNASVELIELVEGREALRDEFIRRWDQ